MIFENLVRLGTVAATSVILLTSSVAACERFIGSTMVKGGVDIADWRMDYPEIGSSQPNTPWLSATFDENPMAYMAAVLSTFSEDFYFKDQRLKGSGQESWWIAPWMDFGTHGREPLMGLTKERRTEPGDLSPHSSAGHQVWAVGFYNATGSETIGDIFEDPCDPKFPTSVQFNEGTVSIKFLFTDAPTYEVDYLKGSPIYGAMVDEQGGNASVSERVRRSLRLIQVDVAVKDNRADPVGWVFGTFAWIGPKRGDGLFDNLVPVSLQWGDDPKVYRPEDIAESWINPANDGLLFGWPERPTLGFHGRANGPADGIKSSCLSCHASAKLINLTKVPWKANFDMGTDFADQDKIRDYVDEWFLNLKSSDFYNNDPTDVDPEISSLDYSLQLSQAVKRMCSACSANKLLGRTPSICMQTGLVTEPNCATSSIAASTSFPTSSERSQVEQYLANPQVMPRQ